MLESTHIRYKHLEKNKRSPPKTDRNSGTIQLHSKRVSELMILASLGERSLVNTVFFQKIKKCKKGLYCEIWSCWASYEGFRKITKHIFSSFFLKKTRSKRKILSGFQKWFEKNYNTNFIFPSQNGKSLFKKVVFSWLRQTADIRTCIFYKK